MRGERLTPAGFVVSALLHAGVVGLAFVSWPAAMVDIPEQKPVILPVELLPIAEVTQIRAEAKSDDPVPDPKPAAKPDAKPKTAPKVAEAKPEPEPKKPEPKPEPAPKKPVEKAEAKPKPEPKKPEPKPEPKKPEPKPQEKAEAKPKPEPKKPEPKPEPKKPEPKKPAEKAEAKPKPKPDDKDEGEEKPAKKPEKPAKKPEPFDPQAAIAGLRDDSAEDEAPKGERPQDESRGERTKQGDSLSEKETMAVIDAMQAQIARCWSPPAGAPDAERLIVQMRINLNRDGSLNGMPEFLEQGRMSDEFYRVAAEAARRAVIQCQPYELPGDAFDGWKSLRLRFNPAKMLGL
jgi:TolA protein